MLMCGLIILRFFLLSTPPFLDSSDSKLCECAWAPVLEHLVDVCAWQPEDRIVVILLLNAQMETDDFCSLWANLHHHGQIIKHERVRLGWRETNIWRSNLFMQNIHIGLQYNTKAYRHTPICKAARGIRILRLEAVVIWATFLFIPYSYSSHLGWFTYIIISTFSYINEIHL